MSLGFDDCGSCLKHKSYGCATCRYEYEVMRRPALAQFTGRWGDEGGLEYVAAVNPDQIMAIISPCCQPCCQALSYGPPKETSEPAPDQTTPWRTLILFKDGSKVHTKEPYQEVLDRLSETGCTVLHPWGS